MASLMENLIDILQNISSEYDNLLGLSMKKKPVIVAGNLEELTRITEEEQFVVARINRLDAGMQEAMSDIANVINKDVKELKLMVLIQFLEPRPAEQQKLAAVYDKLQDVVHSVVRVNQQNSELIKNALEMVAFDMNVLQAMRVGPETANYNRGAYSAGSLISSNFGGFDAKQ